ncbi:MAG TPA: imidazole glycerol phosphate synthase subunit HisH [Candidatus Baltobacteraceae bacterium]|nr:imidazole glycerol phosphate synthase subunit HisH [Candidatus Baltobacteraceae bacterium]
MLAVIDYGGGNLGSLIAALRRRGAPFAITDNPASIERADAAVLPGDGAFGATMQALRDRRLDRAIVRHVKAGKPFLGICVGMQILFEDSDEFGHTPGLGIVPGHVSRFAGAPRVPHMGWNELELTSNHPFVQDVGAQAYAYFLHSYRAPVGPDTAAACTHGERFCAIVARGNVMGTQFHPEKSQRTGARLLDNFLRLSGEAAT